MCRIIIVCSLIAVLPLSAAAMNLPGSDINPRLLDYGLLIEGGESWSRCRPTIDHPLLVQEISRWPGDTFYVARAYNPLLGEGGTGSVFIRIFDEHIISENPTYMTIEDMCRYRDSRDDRYYLAHTCYQNDSAFIRRIIPGRSRDMIFLATGEDRSGDGHWKPQIRFIRTFDYDYDGVEEAFVHLNPIRDLYPRRLYCIELENLRIEWSLDVVTTVHTHAIFACGDSANPALILSTYGASQGAVDSNFKDIYSYFTRINSRGEVEFNKQIGAEFYSTLMISVGDDSLFYLYHGHEPIEPGSYDSTIELKQMLSLVDKHGNFIKTINLAQNLDQMFTFDYGMDGDLNLFLVNKNERVRIYDRELNLEKEVRDFAFGSYIGSDRIAGQEHPVMFFVGEYLTILSNELKLLGASWIEKPARHFQPLTYDSAGDLKQFYLGSPAATYKVAIEGREFAEILRRYISEYDFYILVAAISLLCIVTVLVISRRRIRQNLNLITSQKEEIEVAHERLQKAHAELDQATEQLISHKSREAADEAYRIASAQFRHEISNALGSVNLFLGNATDSSYEQNVRNRINDNLRILENCLAKIDSGETLSDDDREKIREHMRQICELISRHFNGLEDIARRGVERGMGLAERLRRMERIEYDETMEKIEFETILNDIRREFEPYLQQNKIETAFAIECREPFYASPELFAMMFGNLMENSIHALQDKKSPDKQIRVEIDCDQNNLRIIWFDNGPGLEKSMISKIVRPFFTTKPTSGSGLGLTIVQNITRKYNGEISLESSPGGFMKIALVFSR